LYESSGVVLVTPISRSLNVCMITMSIYILVFSLCLIGIKIGLYVFLKKLIGLYICYTPNHMIQEKNIK